MLLTEWVLGNDGLRGAAGFSRPNLILGQNSELILLLLTQVSHYELGAGGLFLKTTYMCGE